jgi:hypothetical protein
MENTRIRACLVAMACWCAPAFAAHPLVTEDTGTQGTGNVEIENGLSWTRAAGATVFQYQPQVSYGLVPALDLIVQPSWIRQPGAQGWGDTNLDFKWRFFGAAPWSYGVRAGAALATGEHGLGLPHGTTSPHGTLIATYDEAPWMVHANLGLDHNPPAAGTREYVPRASVAVMWSATERLVWTMDAGVSADPDPHRHAFPATLLGGVIYTVIPGLDVDTGYQATAGARPQAHQWLLGLTYRFAP